MKQFFQKFRLFVASFVSVFLGLGINLSAQSISGVVFFDADNDGLQAGSESGFAGVTVRAYDVNGALVASDASQATLPIGQYTIPGLIAGAKYRLEFVLPSGVSASGQVGSSGSTVQFITAGATNAHLGVYVPSQLSNASNPRLVAGCGLDASNPGMTVTVPSWLYSAKVAYTPPSTATPGAQVSDMFSTQVGVPMGFGTYEDKNLLYISSIASDFSSSFPAAPDGIGAIYLADYLGLSFQGYKLLVNVVGDLGLSVSNTNPIRAGVPNQFAEYGLGGLDLSEDKTKLFVLNMGNGKLIQMDISGVDYASLPATKPNSATELTIPAACTNGTFRPTCVKQYGGLIYVGGVCDATAGTNADLKAEVIAYDPVNNTWASVYSRVLDFMVGKTASGNFGQNKLQVKWNTFPAIPGEEYIQPYISALDFDETGSLIIAISDRQNLLSDYVYVNTGGANAGYLIRTWKEENGTFSLESGGVSGPYTSAARLFSSGTNPGQPANVASFNQGPGDRFFYEQGLAFQFGIHTDLFSSGMIIIPGKNEIVAGFTDPLDYSTLGVRYFNTKTGQANFGISLSPGKRNLITGVGRLTNSAPIEIGNRVWLDSDADGVQDADENGIAGITVELFQAANLIATVVTDMTGDYIFSNNPASISSSSQAYNIAQLRAKGNYTIRIPNATGGSKQAALGTNVLTSANITSNGQDERDSDGAMAGNDANTTVVAGLWGHNDHVYDFGFKPASCAITVSSATPSACTPASNTYSVNVVVTYSSQPTGSITVTTSNGGSVTVAQTTSPQTITLTGLSSDGVQDIDVTAFFVNENICSNTVTGIYDAPAACPPCNISGVSANASACTPGPNTYSVSGMVAFANAPATGTLTVQITGGGSQVFNAPFTSLLTYSIAGQPADGLSHTVTATFSADTNCAGTVNYMAPPSCAGCPTGNCKTTAVIKN